MKFTETHEWVEIEKDIGKVGVSTHAQHELGDIVYVELPKIGKFVAKGDAVAVLESTKAAADVYAPVSGTIVSINERLKETPELINSSPEKEAWLFTLSIKNAQEYEMLMDSATYQSKFS